MAMGPHNNKMRLYSSKSNKQLIMKKIYNNRGHRIALNNLDINVVNEITGLKYNGTIFSSKLKLFITKTVEPFPLERKHKR